MQQRNQALEDGYAISRRYDCIDKDSYRAVAEQQARWAAITRPRPVRSARRSSPSSAPATKAERGARRRRRGSVRPKRRRRCPWSCDVDANRASAAELAAVVSLDADVVAQIVAERQRRPFRDWSDLVSRVTGLSAAQPAVFASVCGLTVNGAQSRRRAARRPLAAQLARRNARRRAATAGH